MPYEWTQIAIYCGCLSNSYSCLASELFSDTSVAELHTDRMKGSWLVKLCLLACVFFTVFAKEDEHGEHVLPYNAEFFASEIPKRPHLVMFFAPW